MGVSRDSNHPLMYELLRNAQANDKLVVTYSDNSTKTFHFTSDNRYLGWDAGAGYGLSDENGNRVNIVDTLNDQNITEIRRYYQRTSFPAHPNF